MIAFFGLGNMGLPMAANLAKRFDVVCHDVSADARTGAREAGLALAEDAAAAVARAEAVITMLPAGEFVLDLLVGKDGGDGGGGLLARAAAGTLFVDCSTTSPAQARELAAAATARGMRFLDAPVSGGIGGARAGTLTFLCGGSDDEGSALAAARPMLECMGGNVFSAGAEAGMGQAAKLCNNMMLSVQMLGACEALAMGEKMGLDAKTLTDIMVKSSGGNWVVQKYNPVPGVLEGAPAGNGYRTGFMVDLMVKDSDLAQAAAKAADASVPLSRRANELFHLLQERGYGQRDFSSAYKAAKEGDLDG